MAAARSARDKKVIDFRSHKNSSMSNRTVSRLSALITCYNAAGQQLNIPTMALGESFTGFKELSREIVRLGAEQLDHTALDVTLMQTGPSSFDLQFDVKDVRSGMSRVMASSRHEEEAYAVLDRAMAAYGTVGEAVLLIAAHPGCELRRVETFYGPDIEIVVDGSPRMIMHESIIDMIQAPSIQAALRTVMVPLANPEFTYVTIRGEIQNVQGLANQVMVSNEHLREFLRGEPLKPKSFEPTVVNPSQDELRWSQDRD